MPMLGSPDRAERAAMKAVQVGAPGKAEFTVLAEPHPTDSEVLVEVRTVGICGTDRRLNARGATPPRVPGHEIAGVLADGTQVGVHPDVGCGNCTYCRDGFENRCPERVSIGLDRDGGMAELVAVPKDHVVPLEGVDIQIGPLLEPLACCLHAVDMLEPVEGMPAMVVGAGPMGILATWTLQARGARVVVVQRSAERRRQAALLGADAVAGPDDDPALVLGAVPHLAIVTAPSSDGLSQALEQVAVGGQVHAFAGMPQGGQIDANLVHYRHLTLLGSTGSRLADYREARTLVAEKLIPLHRLPVTRRSLDEAPAVLSGVGGDDFKTLIDVGGQVSP